MTNQLVGTPFQKHDISLTANQLLIQHLKGKSIFIKSVSGSVKFSINDSEESNIEKGFQSRLQQDFRIEKVSFRETAGSTASVTFVIADSLFDIKSFIISDPVEFYMGDTVDLPSQKTITTSKLTIFNADPTTDLLRYIQNNGTVDIWYGPSTVDADTERGIKLAPGEMHPIPNTALIQAQRKTAASTNGKLNIIRYQR